MQRIPSRPTFWVIVVQKILIMFNIYRLFTQTNSRPNYWCQPRIVLWGKKEELLYLIHPVSDLDILLNS